MASGYSRRGTNAEEPRVSNGKKPARYPGDWPCRADRNAAGKLPAGSLDPDRLGQSWPAGRSQEVHIAVPHTDREAWGRGRTGAPQPPSAALLVTANQGRGGCGATSEN